MAVRFYDSEALGEAGNAFVCGSEDLTEVADLLRKHFHESKRICVWRRALTDVRISQWLGERRWPTNIVSLFRDPSLWPWKFRRSCDLEDSVDNNLLLHRLDEIIRQDPPEHNLIASLRLRHFDDTAKYVGSAKWLHDIMPYLNSDEFDAFELIQRIQKTLVAAERVGLEMFVEKFSIILNEAEIASRITLTPQLHTDREYGPFEAGICSLFSDVKSSFGSTVFFPEVNLNDPSFGRPITGQKLLNHPDLLTGFRPKTGDLVIFSGRKDATGNVSSALGVPHISPEEFGPTRRFVILVKCMLK